MIYTSNYSRASRFDRTKYYLVQISATRPRWAEVNNAIPCLFPEFTIVRGYKDGTVSESNYKELYMALLNKHEEAIRNEIHLVRESANGRDVVLLCWCAKGAFCHRRLFADWWESLTGEPVVEL